MTNRAGRRPSRNRWYRAGRSLRWVRSPDAPKMTMAVGSGGSSFPRVVTPASPPLLPDGVAPELVTERGDHLGGERLVLPRGEPGEQGQRRDRGGDVLVDGR